MRLRPFALALAVVAAASVSSCAKDSGAPPPAAAALAPVPAPAGLVAEVFIAKPNATWTKARELVGGPAKLLPQSYAMLVTTLLGLPPGVAEHIDNDVPTVGAVTSDGKNELAVLAIHLRDATKVVKAMTEGDQARFLAQEDAPSHVTLLSPKPGQTALSASLGVTANYLLVGYAPDALLAVGPYAARTVPAHPMPTEDVVLLSTHDALAGPIKARISTWWTEAKRALDDSDKAAREKHGGATPTFGDPKAAIARADGSFQALFALMGDLAEARTAVTLDEAGAHVRTTLKPFSADGPARAELAAMVVGDQEPLLDLPPTISVAMLSRDTLAVRERTSKEQEASIAQLLAGKLDDPGKARVAELLAAWAKGRGDWLAMGGQLAAGKPSIYVRAAVADEALLEKGVRGLLDVPKIPAIGEWASHWLGDTKVSAPAPAGDGVAGNVARVDRTAVAAPSPPKDKPKDKGSKKEAERFEVGWAFEKGVLSTVAGEHGKDELKALAAARGVGLRSDPDIKRTLEALGGDSAFTLLVLPMRLVSSFALKKLPPGANVPAAPVALSLGKTGDQGFVRVDASPAAVREMAKIRSLD